MIKTIFLISYLLISSIQAKENFGAIKISEIVSIYDGDTFRVNIDDYPPIVGKNISIRINGIDTPEKRTKCKKEKILAQRAKELTVQMLTNAKEIKLLNTKRGKYFRIVADVYVDDVSIADTLIKNNLAVPYNGGTKTKNWCE